MTNQSGDLATTKTGDLSHPLAERRAPGEDLRAACGDGSILSAMLAQVPRHPYLQRVTDGSARIMWTATMEAPGDVRVTTPDGTEVATMPAAVVDGGEAADGAVTYEVIADGLQPDSIYCYDIAIGDLAIGPRAGFRTAPAAGTGALVSFVAFGDSGNASGDQLAIRDQLDTVPFQLMVHTGDIAYDNGTLLDFEGEFFQIYADMLHSFAMWPAIGNHDESGVYEAVFDLPWGEHSHNWYSYDHGDVHFVALDTNDIGSEQATWLDDDLAATDRAWTIVYGHHPAYSSGEHGSTKAFQNTFGPILVAHHVDLVLAGHDHDYERMKPQDGVNYVVTGGGGRGTRAVGSSSFTAFSEQVLNFVYVEIEGNQLLLHAIDGDGTEFDQLAVSH